MSIPLNVLDLVPVSSGATGADALRHSVDLAQQAERLGYERYWVAEHHLNPGVAGTSPAVVIALLAGATNTIRVGAGAVQMGHRTALSTIEEFGLLDAAFPGRIDLGLGRSGGAPPAATQDSAASPVRLVDRRTPEGLLVPEKVSLAAVLGSPRFLLQKELLQLPGAQVAGKRGIRFATNYHVNPSGVIDAAHGYRAAFEPSEELSRPHVAVSADVVVADDEATARELATGYGLWVRSIRTGEGAICFPTPDEARAWRWTDEDRALVQDRVDTQFVGTAAQVADRLEVLRCATDADELVVTTITHDHADRVRSYELLAQEWRRRG